MNDFYEANMPDSSKPEQSTDVKTVERFIKDKYVKKLWVNDDDENPVELYQSGELEKRLKKKEKKDKKKKEKKAKKEKAEKAEKRDQKTTNEPNLIDFQEGDDFGDFEQPVVNSKDDGFGDLIGADSNNDFGDFATPSDSKDDEFGDFTAPTASTGFDMNAFASHFTVPTPTPVDTSKNSNLINNLSNMYSQSTATFDPSNKYAALETMGGGSYQTQQAAQNSNMFFGMSMSAPSNAFGYQQPAQSFDSFGFPNLTHTNSYPPSNDAFGGATFPSQSASTGFGFNANFASQPVKQPSFTHSSSYGSTNNTKPAAPGKVDMFGLKETLKKNNKMYKYNHGVEPTKSALQDNNAFSSLVATQWNA